MIECERKSKSHREKENLEVRMKMSCVKSYNTKKKSIGNIITREALLKCDFYGDVLDGVDRLEDYIRVAKILREMRRDYSIFKSQMGMD